MPNQLAPNRLVLYLDIDGVLHTHKEALDNTALNPGCMRRLNALIKILQVGMDLNVDVVLSSAWRHIHGRARTLDLLRQGGYEGPDFLDVTPSGRCRHDEILQHTMKYFTPLSHILILDDAVTIPPLKQRHVMTTMAAGLTPKKLRCALNMCAHLAPKDGNRVSI